MRAERQIPKQLFLAAGQAVEEELRRETALALSEYNHYSRPVASWEDGRVVIIPGWRVSRVGREQRWPLYAQGGEVSPPAPEPQQLFLNFVLEFADKIYIKDEELFIEFPDAVKDVGAFLMNPNNAEVLRDISRAITGSERVSHLIIRDRQPHEKTRGYVGGRVVEELLLIIKALHAKDNHALAQRVEELLRQRAPREIIPPSPILPLSHSIKDDSASSRDLKE